MANFVANRCQTPGGARSAGLGAGPLPARPPRLSRRRPLPQPSALQQPPPPPPAQGFRRGTDGCPVSAENSDPHQETEGSRPIFPAEPTRFWPNAPYSLVGG